MGLERLRQPQATHGATDCGFRNQSEEGLTMVTPGVRPGFFPTLLLGAPAMSSHPLYLSCRTPGSAGQHISHRQCSVAVSELAFLVPSVVCQEGSANPFRDTWTLPGSSLCRTAAGPAWSCSQNHLLPRFPCCTCPEVLTGRTKSYTDGS